MCRSRSIKMSCCVRGGRRVQNAQTITNQNVLPSPTAHGIPPMVSRALAPTNRYVLKRPLICNNALVALARRGPTILVPNGTLISRQNAIVRNGGKHAKRRRLLNPVHLRLLRLLRLLNPVHLRLLRLLRLLCRHLVIMINVEELSLVYQSREEDY
jgi:hypothetical protein